MSQELKSMGFPGGSDGKNLPAVRETWVWSLGLIPGSKRSPGKGDDTHSRILAWRIPQTEGSGGLQAMGSQRVGHKWETNTFTLSCKVVSCTHIAFSNWIVIIILSNPHNKSLRYKLLFLFNRRDSKKWRNVHKATRPQRVQMISTTQIFPASSPVSTIYLLPHQGTQSQEKKPIVPNPRGLLRWPHRGCRRGVKGAMM